MLCAGSAAYGFDSLNPHWRISTARVWVAFCFLLLSSLVVERIYENNMGPRCPSCMHVSRATGYAKGVAKGTASPCLNSLRLFCVCSLFAVQARAALRAAYNDVSRAASYLMEGIPDDVAAAQSGEGENDRRFLTIAEETSCASKRARALSRTANGESCLLSCLLLPAIFRFFFFFSRPRAACEHACRWGDGTFMVSRCVFFSVLCSSLWPPSPPPNARQAEAPAREEASSSQVRPAEGWTTPPWPPCSGRRRRGRERGREEERRAWRRRSWACRVARGTPSTS